MHDLVIIGGGASGLFAAALAIKRGLKTAIIESNDRVGKKLLATGNGRCNIAASNIDVSKYNTPKIQPLLQKYSVKAILEDFAKLGIHTREEDGRLYPYSGMASSVLNALRNATVGADIFLSTRAEQIVRISDGYKVLGKDFSIQATRVCLATGSQATFGSASYELLSEFGCKVNNIIPSLLPISVVGDGVKGMQGVRQFVRATLIIAGKEVYSECGEMQFKDQAISGIVTFNLSARLAWSKARSCQIAIDFAPDLELNKLRKVLEVCGLDNMYHKSIVTAISNYSNGKNIAEALKNYKIDCKPINDITKGQVANGGIDLTCIDLSSMQVAGSQGLFAIGEALDVDGECGGYNLFWAWASAKNMIDNLR